METLIIPFEIFVLSPPSSFIWWILSAVRVNRAFFCPFAARLYQPKNRSSCHRGHREHRECLGFPHFVSPYPKGEYVSLYNCLVLLCDLCGQLLFPGSKSGRNQPAVMDFLVTKIFRDGACGNILNLVALELRRFQFETAQIGGKEQFPARRQQLQA